MPVRRLPCPKCRSQLFREQEVDSRFSLPSAWACLQCGWRQRISPEQFTRRFALATTVESWQTDSAVSHAVAENTTA